MKPKKNEKYQDFVKRFMKDKKMKKEYPDVKQRFAVMSSYWRRKK
jgi:hypothetical protein